MIDLIGLAHCYATKYGYDIYNKRLMVNIYEYPSDLKLLDGYRIAVMQAAKEGKPVQYCSFGSHEWENVVSSPLWNWANTLYRIDPASNPKEYVPWNFNTVPKRSCILFRFKGDNCTYYALSVIGVNGLHLGRPTSSCPGHLGWGTLLSGYEYSIDEAKTWQPCGVLK